MKSRTWGTLLAILGLAAGCAAPASSTKSAEATPAASQSTDTQIAATAETKKSDPDTTVVCENRPVTGTRLSRRVCRTLRQVQEERDAAQMEMLRPRPTPVKSD